MGVLRTCNDQMPRSGSVSVLMDRGGLRGGSVVGVSERDLCALLSSERLT